MTKEAFVEFIMSIPGNGEVYITVDRHATLVTGATYTEKYILLNCNEVEVGEE